MVVLYVSTEHKHTESLHLHFILSCEDAVVKVWLGLGTKITYLGTGKDHDWLEIPASFIKYTT